MIQCYFYHTLVRDVPILYAPCILFVKLRLIVEAQPVPPIVLKNDKTWIIVVVIVIGLLGAVVACIYLARKDVFRPNVVLKVTYNPRHLVSCVPCLNLVTLYRIGCTEERIFSKVLVL